MRRAKILVKYLTQWTREFLTISISILSLVRTISQISCQSLAAPSHCHTLRNNQSHTIHLATYAKTEIKYLTSFIRSIDGKYGFARGLGADANGTSIAWPIITDEPEFNLLEGQRRIGENEISSSACDRALCGREVGGKASGITNIRKLFP